ncbi:lipoate--protein ligase family protein [Laspinema olomoucense]|uniref:lipoate--protein ligase family protein n=1 Tax=Laspinema olomoucense TaxID=3231600 RepID=UPI0021BAB9BE|nr:biotin/lipoate A/B protein ligase family protein [Laspinema sp. D3c]MCT7995913.1 lipoate--protein ligase family protein [Laspinema sp. D3c]
MHSPLWRLIPPIQVSGSMQMAIDLWLLDQYVSGNYPPVLRFYIWDPVAISLGYHQRRWPQRWENLMWQGMPIELVRRPTGGRAVLHQGDLTYMVVMSDLDAGGVIGSKRSPVPGYEAICEFLIAGWRSLGVQLQYGRAGRGYRQTANCFATATGADLVLPSGEKFIGSAQLRRNGAVLQQGSMQLNPSPEMFAEVFGTEGRLHSGLPVLSLPLEVLRERAIASLVESASSCFGVQLIAQPLSEGEWEEINCFEHSNPVCGEDLKEGSERG